METTDDRGGSLTKQVAAGVAIGVATTAAGAAAKKLLGTDSDDGEQGETRSQAGDVEEEATRRTPARRLAGTSSRKRATAKRSSAKRSTAKRSTAKRSSAKRT